ncbi:MAG: tetratricopeptide repeat protein [Bdellovibrionaceae bacterium]|nr:tetratricopeptide repeat protein [Pseudobdellovibrionaceae bacterium]
MRRKNRQFSRFEFAGEKPAIVVGRALAIALVLVSIPAHAIDLRGIKNNNDGVTAYKKEKYSEAFQKFAQGMGDLPFDPRVHYNLGRTLLENKEYEKAYTESMMAAKLAEKDPQTKFAALFQAATALAQQKKVDEAIAKYQEALELQPDSVETKTNIELLISQGGNGGGDDSQEQQQGDQDQQKQGQGDQEQQQPQKVENPKGTPKPFQSKELSKKDVENILDELRAQEENIRAKFQREGAKDAPKDKDW